MASPFTPLPNRVMLSSDWCLRAVGVDSPATTTVSIVPLAEGGFLTVLIAELSKHGQGQSRTGHYIPVAFSVAGFSFL